MLAVSVFVRTLYIAALAVFMMSIRCDKNGAFYYYQDQSCKRLPRLATLIASIRRPSSP